MLDYLRRMIDDYGEETVIKTMRTIFGNEPNAITMIHALRTGFITAPDLVKNTGISEATIYRAMRSLREKDLLEHCAYSPRPKKTKWSVRGGPRISIYQIVDQKCLENLNQRPSMNDTKKIVGQLHP